MQEQPSFAQEHHLEIRRTARFYTLGIPSANIREVWFVIHGYGQLGEYFIRHFRDLDDGTRLIVAPEGLSRFYLKEWSRVGATWMTREDREHEIHDYVTYLDTLFDHIFTELQAYDVHRASIRITTVGFSQGATTLCRWLTLGKTTAERLILWAGGLPTELDIRHHATLFQSMKPVLVCGTQDEFISEEQFRQQQQVFIKHGITPRVISFEGGHNLVSDIIQQLAQEGE